MGEIILSMTMTGIYFLVWPTAAYLSAKKIRHHSCGDSFRFAAVVGVFFAVIGCMLSTLTLPLRTERHGLIVAVVLGWIALPFVLVSIEMVARRSVEKRRS